MAARVAGSSWRNSTPMPQGSFARWRFPGTLVSTTRPAARVDARAISRPRRAGDPRARALRPAAGPKPGGANRRPGCRRPRRADTDDPAVGAHPEAAPDRRLRRRTRARCPTDRRRHARTRGRVAAPPRWNLGPVPPRRARRRARLASPAWISARSDAPNVESSFTAATSADAARRSAEASCDAPRMSRRSASSCSAAASVDDRVTLSTHPAPEPPLEVRTSFRSGASP